MRRREGPSGIVILTIIIILLLITTSVCSYSPAVVNSPQQTIAQELDNNEIPDKPLNDNMPTRALPKRPFGSKYSGLYVQWLAGEQKQAIKRLDELANMNTTYVEFHIEWSNIEPMNDVWLWEIGEDTLMQVLINLTTRDLVPVIIIKARYWDEGKTWAVDGIDRKINTSFNDSAHTYAPYYFLNGSKQQPRPGNTSDPEAEPAGAMDEYYEFVFKLMDHYRNYVHYYEMENEPGRLTSEFLGDMYDFFVMMREANKASDQIFSSHSIKIDIINPHMGIIDGEKREYPRFNLINLFEFSGEYKTFFDILSWHNNNFASAWDSSPGNEFETIDGDLKIINEILENNGIPNILIFNTESAIQIGQLPELIKRNMIDIKNNVVPFVNYVSSREVRPDHSDLVKIYSVMTSKIGDVVSVEEINSGPFSKSVNYGYKLNLSTKTAYVLWSESDIARNDYGGNLVYFTSEQTNMNAINIINGTRDKWKSKNGLIANQEFIISFRNNETFDINKISFLNHYFDKHGQNTSVKDFQLWYTSEPDWEFADWISAETFYSYDKGFINISKYSNIIEGNVTSWEYAELRPGIDIITIQNSTNDNNGNYTIKEVTNNKQISLVESILGESEHNLPYSINNIPSNTLKKYWLNPDLGTVPPAENRPFVYLKEQEFYFNNYSSIENVTFIRLVIKNNYGNSNFISLNNFKVHKAGPETINFESHINGLLKVTDIFGKVSIVESSELELTDSPVFVEYLGPYRKPDIVIELDSLKVTPEKPTIDDNITIKVTIQNIGTENVTSAQVVFYDGSPDSNGVQIGTVKSISNLLLGTQALVTSDQFKLTEGDHTIFIEITNSSPQEFNYTNNQASKKLKVLPSTRIPDLMLETNNISFSKTKLFAGDNVFVLAKIVNIGIVAAQSATITFYLGDPSTNGTQLGGNKTVALLTPDNSTTIESDAWIAEEGAYDIFVKISGTIPIELNITNNIANKQIIVNPPIEPEYPDLAITTDDIIFLTTELVEGAPIQINAIINNIGNIATSFANVTFYIGDPTMGGTRLGAVKNISGLEKDNMISITSDVWYPKIGKYTVFVQIADTKPVENNFTNNNAKRDITIQATSIEFDCGLESVDINISTPSPSEGENIVIIVNVHIYNLTTLNQRVDLPVRLLVDNITHTQKLISIDNSLIQLNFVWRARKGEHKFTIILDPENDIIEADEQNNVAVKQVFVQPADSDRTTDKPKKNQYLSIAIISNVITIFVLLIIFLGMSNQYRMIQDKQFIKPPSDKKVMPAKSQKRKFKRKLKRKIKTEPKEETDLEE